MLIGHTHVSYSSNIGETIIGQPRNLARDVVRFDLSIDVSSDYSKVISKEVNIIDMEDYEPDDKLRETTRAEHEATLSFIIGMGDAVDGLDSGAGVFGTATQDFQPVNEIKSIPEGKLRDTAVVDLINKVQLEISNADVSAASLFQDTSDIGKGDITYGDVFNIYKFDNVLYTVDITGKELKNYMEWSASSYNIWKSGDINISFNEDRPGYLYDIFEGVDYKIDISKPVGSRIVDVMFKGEPLQDDQKLILAVNNYRYNSTLKSEGIVAGNKTWESPASIRDYIVEYINERGEISPEVNNNWKITGVDLDSPYRDEIIKMVNDGVLEVPYYKSLNVDELRAQGVI
jgi:2',3'-cyclic-nucleotide 2'-phosphodiesterase/3'-nucleotidase